MSTNEIALMNIIKTMKGSYFKKLKFLARATFYRKELQELYKIISNEKLNFINKHLSDIYNKPFRQYMYCRIKTSTKFHHIKSHYNFIAKKFEQEALENIYLTNNISLISFNLEDIGKIDIKLCYIGSLGKEGEMTLLIALNDKDLYSIAFSFYENQDEKQFIICGIQSRGDIDTEIIKLFTKKMHGIRPRNYLFFVIRQLCELLSINSIKAITTEFHVANCSHVNKTGKFMADYNLYWEEENGLKEGIFYTLSTIETRKSMEEIASKKRSMYNKRFNMLDEHKVIIQNKFKELLNKKY